MPIHVSSNVSENFNKLSNVSFDIPDNLTSESLCSELAQWAIINKTPHTSLNGLLVILKKHTCFSSLPSDARTVLKTKPVKSESIKDVSPGKYYHFGIENGILRHSFNNISVPEIKLVIGIDGLPIAKSTSTQFWPILAYIRPMSDHVFPIGLYCGSEKPENSNEYLKVFVSEAKYLVTNGVNVNNKIYKVVIDVFCCDTPARSFVMRTKGHRGYFSCSRCQIEGVHIDSMCFPYTDLLNRPPKRTHKDYVERIDGYHHARFSTNSCLIEIPSLDIVNHFSLDYMHLVCLGTVKRIMGFWMNGP